jgi:putative PIN family toxin of toxin-antitoxin system
MQYHHVVSSACVLDTDVLVAAFRSARGASRQILFAALDHRFELLLSVPLLLEYEAVLNRPKHRAASGVNSTEIGHVLDDLAGVARPVALSYRWRPRLPDPDDDMVFETAANGNADAIVTFNRRHFVAAAEGFGFAILLPREALQLIRRPLK